MVFLQSQFKHNYVISISQIFDFCFQLNLISPEISVLVSFLDFELGFGDNKINYLP